MKYYTLYYQPKTALDRVIAVATSDSLLKLLRLSTRRLTIAKVFRTLSERRISAIKTRFNMV